MTGNTVLSTRYLMKKSGYWPAGITIESPTSREPAAPETYWFIRKSPSFKPLKDFHDSLWQMALPWPL
ncbi:hypothetical protein MTBBW1_1630035 [Desulfamplus magnetovallimortis]|uniref:Uncharacterized protein n=1 Tax=Desulfamplus magnetovallimortis TaxID=1246637 RepID=A0A1W1H942_9BACT|nr:hypothetical protein MTBBW1_1630035 [Desulfamplus magnetovallimortis]